MLTHGKRGDLVFCFLRGGRLSNFIAYAFPGDTLKISLTANKIILTSGNESGMIEVIDSRTK
jgi:hypothetical protein